MLVVILGNPNAGDDAFGSLVAQNLGGHVHGKLKVVNLCGASPTALLDYLDSETPLTIVDAVVAPEIAYGQVVDLDWNSQARPRLAHDSSLSTHGLSIASQLELAKKLGIGPPAIRLLGAAARSAREGDLPSTEMHAAASEVADRILKPPVDRGGY